MVDFCQVGAFGSGRLCCTGSPRRCSEKPRVNSGNLKSEATTSPTAPSRVRAMPALLIALAIRRDVVPTADPLDGGGRPRPGRVAGALAGRRDRPFQGHRNLPQGPTENSAAPNQHHHLGIMLADQLADPLTGRVASGSGVDFPASRHDSSHDTTPAGPSSAGAARQQLVFAPDRARSGLEIPPAGSRRRPKSGFSLGRPSCRLCIKSEITDFLRFRSGSTLANPREQTKLKAWSGSRTTRFRFLELQSSGSAKTGCARSEKPRPASVVLADPGRLQIP